VILDGSFDFFVISQHRGNWRYGRDITTFKAAFLDSVRPEMRYFVQGQGMRPAKGGINRRRHEVSALVNML
jgi:hypothetical protein